ncbi:glycosyltransferase [Methylotuvimicrobium buryatense]|nr:glycosyltransferase [Methylotuvimicrobium buryatense]
MNILFLHQNFPAQFSHVATRLAQNPNNKVVAIKQSPSIEMDGIGVVAYQLKRGTSPDIHPLMQDFEPKILRAEAVAKTANFLKAKEFNPDVVVAHPGWGETLLLKDIWPDAKYLGYFEYFYSATGQDFDFDPEFSQIDGNEVAKLRLKNTINLHALNDMDEGITPTNWQLNTYPEWARDKIKVMHEGIDTEYFCPNPKQTLSIPEKNLMLSSQDEIITYAARYLEPVRGFHCFMRALPELLKRRPNAHVMIMGNNQGGYGPEPSNHDSYVEMMLEELKGSLDPQRVHILGRLPKNVYRNVLQLSSVHVYLTYPFLLSWSMLEAMASGPIIVASDTAPVREIIKDNKNGLLFDFFDIQAMVDRVEQALTLTTRKANAIKKASRKTIEDEYNFETCLEKLIEKIEALAGSVEK